MNRSWKALGDFVLLGKEEAVNDYGIIVDTPFKVISGGGFVPIDLYEGDIVSVNVSTEELTKLEPSNPTSPVAIHYNKIQAVLSEQEAPEIMYADTSDLL